MSFKFQCRMQTIIPFLMTLTMVGSLGTGRVAVRADEEGASPTIDSDKIVSRILSEVQRQESAINSGIGRCVYRIEIDGELYHDADVDYWFSGDSFRAEIDYRLSRMDVVPMTRRVVVGDPSGVQVVTWSPNYRGEPCRVEVREDFYTATSGMWIKLHKAWKYPVNAKSSVLNNVPQVTNPSDHEVLLTSHETESALSAEVLISAHHWHAHSYRSKQNGVDLTNVEVDWSDKFGDWHPAKLVYEARSRGRLVRDTVEFVSLQLNASVDNSLLLPALNRSCDNSKVVDWRPSETGDREVKVYENDAVPSTETGNTAAWVSSLQEAQVSVPAPMGKELPKGWRWITLVNLLLLGLIGIYVGGRLLFRRLRKG